MTTPIELKRLLQTAQREFRTLNRNRNLTGADKKQLKEFYLQHVLAPRARMLLRDLYPAGSGIPSQNNGFAGKRLLTAQELEKWLKIDAKTIHSYANRNIIPPIRIKRSVRFRESDIQQWIARHRRKPVPKRKSRHVGRPRKPKKA